MGTKEEILTLFESHRGSYLSGEEIAEKLFVSRTAVWKAVKILRNEGYHIEAVRNKGYCLSAESDILSLQGIQKYLKPICSDLKIEVYPTITSTNIVAREKAASGMPGGYVVLANTQTQGRGRRDRSFFSPCGTGIYMSVLFRPDQYSMQDATGLTTMAAVAVCEAIEAVSDEQAQIKWVNDVYVAGKKVCGILTEASCGLEDGCLEYAVVGIGINVTPPSDNFPTELKNIAGTIFGRPQADGKNRLAAEVLNRYMAYYLSGDLDYVQHYRRRSLAIGKEISVISSKGEEKAVALAIDDACRLVVRYQNGITETLSSGEISVKIS